MDPGPDEGLSLGFLFEAIGIAVFMSTLRDCILVILQLTAIYNATQLGWDVRVLGDNKIALKKKIKNMTHLDYNVFRLVEVLLDLKK
jgi:hypothetical protein